MLYTIERNFTGYTEDQIRAAAFRALLCITFFPGMRWIRSFYDPVSEQSRCFYEANADSDLVHHGMSMAIPIGDVRPVVEVRRDGDGITFGEPTDSGDSRNPSGGLSAWVVRYRAEGLQIGDVAERFRPAATATSSWLRAYVDSRRDEVFTVFRRPIAARSISTPLWFSSR